MITKSNIVLSEPTRFRRSMIACFGGEIAFLFMAWYLLSISDINLIYPTEPLRWLTMSAFLVSLIAMGLILSSKSIQNAIGIIAIFHSLLFAPTLLITGGFISPFAVVYLLTMILTITLVEIVPRVLSNITSFIIILSYITVSLLQKMGVQPVKIDFVQPLLENDAFFWLIFITGSFSFLHGFVVVSASTRNIRETFTELINAHRHVAEGTAYYTGKPFFTRLVGSLAEALSVNSAFFLQWNNSETDEVKKGRIYKAIDGEITEKEIELPAGFFERIGLSKENKPSPQTIFPPELAALLELSHSELSAYWTLVTTSSGLPSGILCILHPVKLTSHPMVGDIMKIFSGRAGAEMERIESEKKWMEMQEQLYHGRKMQAIGQLAGGIAHDFNNMLNGIVGYASLITRKLPQTSPLRTYAQKVILIGEQAGQMTAQLLAYSRKPGSSQRTNIDVIKLVDDVTGILGHTIDKRIHIQRNINSLSTFFFGDPVKVQSAILNLAINASDAMVDGGDLIIKTEMKYLKDTSLKDTVSGKLIPCGNYLCISVQDNGCGMSADTIKRIFEPFFTTKKVGRGTGLGLTAVYECIKSHDGYITVNSVENVGSTFCMYFPNPQETVENGDGKAPVEESVSLSIISDLRINRKKIMVIDDEATTRDALSDWLGGSNYKVICFSNGEEAIERFKAESRQISCVLLDMMLPGLNGADVFGHLKAIDPDVRVIIMTGYCKEEDLDLLLKSGVITVLSKPFNHSKLMDVIETVSNYTAPVIKNS